MREVASAAARHRDPELYKSIVKIGRAALSQGVELVPSGGLFLQCPVCGVSPGQRCINVPKNPLQNNIFHPARIELAEKALKGEVPLPVPLH
ncbi:zinc finger domain-containing protein [Micromonospora foliorum]|uniref:zinc finger domain-containing protein n=1 Tax=Micromonospora foliorum TaxID=2911210 RepID=UPI003F88590E